MASTVKQPLQDQDKRSQIVDRIRSAIVSGELVPGERLPTREELSLIYGVSSNTVQVALAKLTQDGFLVAKRKSGTFVSANPPHVSQFAMVFVHRPSHDPLKWSRYYATLCDVAAALQGELHPRRLQIHFGVEGHADNEAHQMLCHAIQERRIAGVIFPSKPNAEIFEGSPLLEAPGIARVHVGQIDDPSPYPIVRINGQSYVDRAAQRVREMGLHRVAVLAPPRFPIPGARDDDSLRTAICERLQLGGLSVYRPWVQLPDAKHPGSVRALVELLISGPEESRPEAIILCDDYYRDPSVAALLGAGTAALGRVQLISYCNFPAPAYAGPAQVQSLGFDLRKVFRGLVKLLDQQLAGEKTTDIVVDAEFAGEIGM